MSLYFLTHDTVSLLNILIELNSTLQDLIKSDSKMKWSNFFAQAEIILRICLKYFVFQSSAASISKESIANKLVFSVVKFSITINFFILNSSVETIQHSFCVRLSETILAQSIANIFNQPIFYHHLGYYIELLFDNSQTLSPIAEIKINYQRSKIVRQVEKNAYENSMQVKLFSAMLKQINKSLKNYAEETHPARPFSGILTRIEANLEQCRDENSIDRDERKSMQQFIENGSMVSYNI